MSDTKWLNEICKDHGRLQREAAKRRKVFKEESVPKAMLDEYIADGWEIDRELKLKVKLRRPFSHDERLENKVWHLAYLLGYPEISEGRNFQVLIKRRQ